MKKSSGIFFLMIIAAFTWVSPSATAKVKLKSIFIKDFTAGTGLTKLQEYNYGNTQGSSALSENIAVEIKDFMSESLVRKQEYTLMSDDEVRVALDDLKKRQLIGGASDDADSAQKLLENIETDYLIFGTIYYKDSNFVIEATLLEFSEKYGVHEKNRGDVRFGNNIYVDRASRALAEYLFLNKKDMEGIFGKTNPIEAFYKEMGSMEKEMQSLLSDHEKGKRSIDSANVRRNSYLIKSPSIRIGYGGLGLAPAGGLLPFSDNNDISEIYSEGQDFIFDVFWYRSKDPVGDGVDLFARGIYRQNTMTDSSMKTITAYGPDADYIFGKYNQLPDKSGNLSIYGGDIGFRFVGTSYFLYEAWSLYLSASIRYLMVNEKYETSGETVDKSFNSWGYTGGLGLEVSIFSYMGLFAEVNYGYTPVGSEDVNIDGLRILYGLTYRTNHWY
jgi:hypothetical protein